MSRVRITTSWDDGHVLDLRVADLLDRYDCKGTFYIAREYVQPRLSDSQLRDLAQRHEIGAHTLTHPLLTQIAPERAREEIIGSKHWLEDVLGKPVTSFCYPRGDHNTAVQAMVREAGYTLARTVEAYVIQPADDPFAVATTMQVYPFPRRPIQARNPRILYQPLLRALPHIARLRLSPYTLLKWERLALRLLERAEAAEGVWHLWGHSWEVEQVGMWQAFEEVLRLARTLDGAAVTNGQLAVQSP